MDSRRDDASDPLEQTTTSLVRGAGADREQFARLYGRVAPSVVAWASLRITQELRRVLEVEDVVQEVWCRALNHLSTYDPTRSSFRTWVFAIANHVILKGYRHLGRGTSPSAAPGVEPELAEIPEEVTSISRRLVQDETLTRCIERLAQLDDDDRTLLIHYGLEGQPAAQVGRLVGLSADAVKKRWQRLRERLREAAAFKDLLSP